MLDKPLSATLNGLLDRAAETSDRLGRSDTAVFAYDPKDWQKSFCRQYRVKRFTPVSAEETFSEALADWFGSAAADLSDAIVSLLGEPRAVYRAENEPALLDALSGSERGFGAFYFTEGAFFVAFETRVLAFLMGNFE